MIGELKHSVTLQRPVRAADGGGGFTETWEDITPSPEIYAAIAPLSGGEQLRFHQLETLVTHRIAIRYRPDVNTSMRLVRGAAVYDIKAVTDRGALGAWLDILAVERKT